MRKLTSLEKTLLTYVLAIVLLLTLAWGVNAIVAAHPARSTTASGLATTGPLMLPTLPPLATPVLTIAPTQQATLGPTAAHKKP